MPNEDHWIHRHSLGWSDLPIHRGGGSRKPYRRVNDAKVHQQWDEELSGLLVPHNWQLKAEARAPEQARYLSHVRTQHLLRIWVLQVLLP